MSSFNIYAVYINPADGELTEDHDCFIGWDIGMNTFFFASGHLADEALERPAVWLGTSPSEYTDLDQFLAKLSRVVKSPDIGALHDQLETRDRAPW